MRRWMRLSSSRGVSRGRVGGCVCVGAEFSRYRVDDFPLYRSSPDGASQIDECESHTETISATYWPRGGFRNIALRTGNRNVLIWATRSRAQSPAPNMLFRNMNLYLVINSADVFLAYIRSGNNLIADGLARWADNEV